MTKERPILFSGPMVRAILDGRKTQTRRVVKPQPTSHDKAEPGDTVFYGGALSKVSESRGRNRAAMGDLIARDLRCPYGVPGDVLWVREGFSTDHRAFYPHWGLVYRADRAVLDSDIENGQVFSPEAGKSFPFRWRPSIHMPRWACRLTLRVESVRVERLNDISEEDAIAEGVDAVSQVDVPRNGTMSRRADFAQLWDRINGKKYPWASNPWTWVVTFARL